jgi:hypothetical protein
LSPPERQRHTSKYFGVMKFIASTVCAGMATDSTELPRAAGMANWKLVSKYL